MRKSMTAYGRASILTSHARWTLEVSSVNRKGLDIHLHLPFAMQFLDPHLRKWIAHVAERGNITLRLTCELKETKQLVKQLGEVKKRWAKVAEELGLDSAQITLPFLLSQMAPHETILDSNLYEKEVHEVWKKASKAWIVMKAQEGRVLVQDIQKRLKMIDGELKKVEKELPKVLEARLKKLQERAILDVDKTDVTEEIIRLKSHMDQMKHYLKSQEKSVGRTLDFLAQEMGREIGTLTAKAGSSEIAKHAVHIKSEIEKIREQVQNIE